MSEVLRTTVLVDVEEKAATSERMGCPMALRYQAARTDWAGRLGGCPSRGQPSCVSPFATTQSAFLHTLKHAAPAQCCARAPQREQPGSRWRGCTPASSGRGFSLRRSASISTPGCGPHTPTPAATCGSLARTTRCRPLCAYEKPTSEGGQPAEEANQRRPGHWLWQPEPLPCFAAFSLSSARRRCSVGVAILRNSPWSGKLPLPPGSTDRPAPPARSYMDIFQLSLSPFTAANSQPGAACCMRELRVSRALW